MIHRRPRPALGPFAAAAVLLAGALAGAEPRQHVARGIAQEGDRLLVEDPAGNVTVDLEGWQPLPDPPAGLIRSEERRVGKECRL